MAKQTQYVTCDLGEVSVNQILAALFAKDDDGNIFIRTVSTSVDCGDLTDAIVCNDGQIDLAELLKKVVVIDPCSEKPALNIAYCTC